MGLGIAARKDVVFVERQTAPCTDTSRDNENETEAGLWSIESCSENVAYKAEDKQT